MQTNNNKLFNVVFYATCAIAVLLVLTIAPGAHAQSGNVYSSSQAQVLSSTQKGVVLQVSNKTVEPSGLSRTGGAAIGGVLGGLLGSSVSGQGKYAVTMLGTTIGGIVGERVANATLSSVAQELVIGLINPATGAMFGTVTVIQPEPFEAMAPNQQVIISNTNGVYRVIKTNFDGQRVSYR